MNHLRLSLFGVMLHLLLLMIALSAEGFAQPLSGSFTVGGAAPDFATPQDAANALKRHGVSGPTFFNIRPGVYTRDGGTRPVIDLDSLVAGLTPANRITFQPDAATEGNVDNTIFEIDFSDPNNGTSALVFVRLDYVTFRNLTFRDADSLQAGAAFLLRCENSPRNAAVDGLIVDGCRFEGNPFFQGSAQFGTDRGVYVTASSANITVRNSSFTRLRRAVEISDPRVPIPGRVIVEDNQFTLSHYGFTGTGNTLGTQINANGDTAIVRRNLLDLEGSNGGFFGITVGVRHTGFVEQNTVKNRQSHNLGDFRDVFQGIAVTDPPGQDADSVLVTNNMVSGNVARSSIGIVVTVPNAKVFHNTVVIPRAGGGATATALQVYSPNGKVLNNILQNYAPRPFLGLITLCDYGNQGASSGLVADYNVFFRTENVGAFIIHNAVRYNSLGAWQTTGQDTNSVDKGIDFIHPDRDVHLSDCQAQDPELLGIPLAEAPFDIDGEARNTPPLRGADETARRIVPMFGDVFRIPVPGRLSDIAIGKFDNIIGDGIAIADVDNQLIRLFHNTASTRSFTPQASLNVLFRPLAIEFIDLDRDGKLDLVAGGDAGFLTVFWGDGLGGFPENTNVQIDSLDAAMEVVAIDTGSVSTAGGPPLHTIIFSSGPNNILPPINFLNFIVNNNGRNLSIETASSVAVVFPLEIKPDTLHGILKNLVGRDLNGDDEPDVAAILGSGVLTDLVAFEDETSFPFVHFSNHSDFDFGAHSYMPTSSLVAGHFDGGANPDLAVTNGAGDIVHLRNQGNLNFIADTISVNEARGLATMDYDNDGNLDIVTANDLLHTNGVTVLLNKGIAEFRPEFNCHGGFAFGLPKAVVASDFDIDGRTDVAVAGLGVASDTVFVLYNFGGGIGTSVANIGEMPKTFSLSQNYPNPFNPSTTIRYQLLTNSEVRLTIYNMLGQRVKTLVQTKQPAGSYAVQWNGTNDAGAPVASGIYFYRLQAGDFVGNRKLLLVR